MTYWALNAWFLGVVAIVGVLALVRLRRAMPPEASGSRAGIRDVRRVGGWLLAVGVAAVVLLVMTAVFDNVMIAVGLVGYDPALISGAKVGVAPLEDFAYAIAAVVLLPSLWVLLEPSRPVVGTGRGPAKTGGDAS